MDAGKTYFHIVGMTEQFRQKFQEGPGRGLMSEPDYRYWQLAIQLAQAQQLSIISARLEEYVKAVNEIRAAVNSTVGKTVT